MSEMRKLHDNKKGSYTITLPKKFVDPGARWFKINKKENGTIILTPVEDDEEKE